MSAEVSQVLTAVDLEFCDQERNYRLIFGRPLRILEHVNTFGLSQKTAYFAAGALFALDLWDGALIANRAGDRRTRTRSRACYVLRAGVPGDEMDRLRQVRPGAHVLIEAHGQRRCKFLLAWLSELAGRCDPSVLPASFFITKSLRVGALIPERHCPSAIGFPADLHAN